MHTDMLEFTSKYYKRLAYLYIKIAAVTLIIAAFFLPSYVKLQLFDESVFTIYLNDVNVGIVRDVEEAEKYIQQIRREIGIDSEELVFVDIEMQAQGEAFLFGKLDKAEDVISNMRSVMVENIKETMKRSYVMKVNNYMVNLASKEDVTTLLQAAIDQYDTEGKFRVDLEQDSEREFSVVTAVVEDMQEKQEIAEASSAQVFIVGGIQDKMFSMFDDVEPEGGKSFADFELGLLNMNFSEEVEIVEAYLDISDITPIDVAIEQVTKEQEVNTIYEVVSGDTLSEISIKVNIPLDRLVEMNDSLQNENSTIKVGQELIITIPEPELSVERQEEVYYEGSYDADIIYIPNDNWYTTQTKTLQEPSAGFRKVVAVVSYKNNSETDREILKEEVVMEAVPKIVERGTKIPPTYIKPVAGGRQSSGFGKRSAPTKGASTYHKGIDWAVPTGTTVMASSAGTVAKAGWGSGYGYVVYINHADGRQTRYGHLSKVLVSVGQKVSQGQKIALSGNTGVSSGPHVHFEILINGSQVNPLNYLN